MRFRPVAAIAILALLAVALTPALSDDKPKDKVDKQDKADKPQDLIVGKWQPADAKDKATLEFLKDGKLKISAEQFTLEGGYKFLDDKMVEVKLAFAGQEKAVKLKITVTKDELTTQEDGKGPDGKDKKVEVFKRAK